MASPIRCTGFINIRYPSSSTKQVGIVPFCDFYEKVLRFVLQYAMMNNDRGLVMLFEWDDEKEKINIAKH